MSDSSCSTATAPWWSGDAPPWETWPGVSLELKAEWSEERLRRSLARILSSPQLREEFSSTEEQRDQYLDSLAFG